MSRGHEWFGEEGAEFQNGEVQGIIQRGGIPWRRNCFVTYTFRVPCGLLGIGDDDDDDDDDDDGRRRCRHHCGRCCRRCCNYWGTRF